MWFKKSAFLVFCLFLLSTFSWAGGASTGNINASFDASSSDVSIDEMVTFTGTSSFTEDCNTNSILTYTWDFGEGANPPTAMETLHHSDASSDHTNYNLVGNVAETVSYSTPGEKTIELTISESNALCNNSPQTYMLTINVAAQIPTLSQWGLIVLALTLMVFGVIATQRKYKTSAT